MLWTLHLEASRLSTGYHVILHQIYAKLAYLRHHIFLFKKYLSVQYVDPGKPGIVARHQGDLLKHFIPWCMKCLLHALGGGILNLHEGWHAEAACL